MSRSRLLPVLFLLLLFFIALTILAARTHALQDEHSPATLFSRVEEGSLLITDLDGNALVRWNENLISRRLPPCSTFKIWNTLIGLEEGVIQDEHTVIPWDGTERSMKEWNRDHTLATAIRYSVVPWYQELARRIGAERMQAWLDRLGYGNADISGGIDRFWLVSSLEISSEEQVALLRRFVRGELPVSRRSADIVRAIINQGYDGFPNVYGKTGSGTLPDGRRQGWFVGFVTGPLGDHVFAVNVLGADVSGQTARTIALEALKKYALILPPQP
jgi:beta-lactamase class D